MVNGMPGAMALECAFVCLNRGYDLVPVGLAGSRNEVLDVIVPEAPEKNAKVQLYPAGEHQVR